MFIQKVLTSFLFSVALFFSVFGQKSFFFERQLTDNPEGVFPVCIKNTPENLAFLTKEKYTIKQITAHWIFFNSSAKWLDDQVKNKTISDFYFEFGGLLLS